jgi:Fe2+ or Zn2+ uptake regulation protein
MTKARLMVCEEVMSRFERGEERFSTKEVVESCDPSYQTVIRALDNLKERGWLIKLEPDERSYEWVASRRARRAFRAYDKTDFDLEDFS